MYLNVCTNKEPKWMYIHILAYDGGLDSVSLMMCLTRLLDYFLFDGIQYVAMANRLHGIFWTR